MASAATPTSLVETASATLFVALELSRSTWLVALHSPLTNKVSQHRLDGGDADGLLALITRKRGQAEERLGQPVRVVCCFEAGYDGFWLHRWLCARGIENRVLDGQFAGEPPGAAGQDGPPRCRRALAHADGAGARRDAGLPRRARAHTGPGGCATAIARAGAARRRAGPTHQPHQGAADDAGHSGLRADPTGLAGAVRGPAH